MHRHIVTSAAQLAYSTQPPSRSRHLLACWAGLNISHVNRRSVATSFFLAATGHIFSHYAGFIIVVTVKIWSSAKQMTFTTQIFFSNCAECMSLAWQFVIASMLWARPPVCCVRQCLLGRYSAGVTMCRCINYLHPFKPCILLWSIMQSLVIICSGQHMVGVNVDHGPQYMQRSDCTLRHLRVVEWLEWRVWQNTLLALCGSLPFVPCKCYRYTCLLEPLKVPMPPNPCMPLLCRWTLIIWLTTSYKINVLVAPIIIYRLQKPAQNGNKNKKL